ncbi:MAG: SDR family oxidoreductase [Actinomycetes bacterium]|jgi:NAD(P)-dependent dehydrogenase (short-subunit alcohol dehydrogenase family)
MRTAVVTGAANGIGAATLELLRSQGFRVIGVDREPSADPDILQADLMDPDVWDGLTTRLVAHAGDIDVLVNCAGVYVPIGVDQLTEQDMRDHYQVNLLAPVALMRSLGLLMAARGYGRIVNVSSIHAQFSEPLGLAYDASKAALEAATRTLATELSPAGVLANSVAPGFVRTRLSIVNGVDELESDWFKVHYLEGNRLPAGRAAEPIEIAHVISFLASEECSYVSGQTITVDGGLTARF